MNVLFVCTQNVGRSQMAAALFNSLTGHEAHADSAGTRVGDEAGQTLAERAIQHEGAQHVLTVMREEGIDIRGRKRRNISEDLLDTYDEIVVMAEPDTIPKYLHDHPRAVYWDVPDPRFKGLDGARATRDDLKRRVVDLIG